MKKRIAFVLALVLVLMFCMTLSSCNTMSQQQMSKLFAVSTEVIVDNLTEDYAFRVVSKNPVARAGVVTFAWYSHAIVGKNTQLHNEWDTDDVGFDRNLAIQNRTWLANRLGTDEDGLTENYGELWILRRYTDFSLAVTVVGENRFINVIKMTGNEVKKVEIEIECDTSSMQHSYFYRIGNKFYIARMNKVVNLDDMTVSAEEVPLYYPQWNMGIEDSRAKVGDILSKADGLGEYAAKAAEASPVLTLREINGKLFYASTENVGDYSELYCMIFDAETGAVIYASVVKTPKQENNSFTGSFVLAEPVLTENGSYYDLY